MVEVLFWGSTIALLFSGLFIIFDRNLSAREERNFLFLAGVSLCVLVVTGIAKMADMTHIV